MPQSKMFDLAVDLLRVEAELKALVFEMEKCDIADRGKFRAQFIELIRRQEAIAVPLEASVEGGR